MNLRTIMATLFVLVLLVACGAPSAQPAADSTGKTLVTVYKAPTWDCCGNWIEHLEQNGFAVKAENLPDLGEVKQRYNVPADLQSCHTAIVDGYIIEGHVPAADIDRLLAERPQIAGLAVPGMPIGSPGMEIQGMAAEPYQVIAFTAQGQQSTFADYPQPAQ